MMVSVPAAVLMPVSVRVPLPFLVRLRLATVAAVSTPVNDVFVASPTVSVAAVLELVIRPAPDRAPMTAELAATSKAPLAETVSAPARGSALAAPNCRRPAETVVVPV